MRAHGLSRVGEAGISPVEIFRALGEYDHGIQFLFLLHGITVAAGLTAAGEAGNEKNERCEQCDDFFHFSFLLDD